MTDTDTAAPAAPIPAALAALGSEAASDSATPPGAAPAGDAPPAPKLTTADEVRGTLAFAVAVGDAKFPGLKAIYPDAVQAQLSGAIAAVCYKYGVTFPGWMEKWRPEIALAMIAFPLIQATAALIKSQLDQPAPAADAGAGQGDQTPGE